MDNVIDPAMQVQIANIQHDDPSMQVVEEPQPVIEDQEARKNSLIDDCSLEIIDTSSAAVKDKRIQEEQSRLLVVDQADQQQPEDDRDAESEDKGSQASRLKARSIRKLAKLAAITYLKKQGANHFNPDELKTFLS